MILQGGPGPSVLRPASREPIDLWVPWTLNMTMKPFIVHPGVDRYSKAVILCSKAAILFLLLLPAPSDLEAQTSSFTSTADTKVHSAGNVLRVVSTRTLTPYTYSGPICQYPPDQNLENMMVGSPVLELAAAISDHDSLKYLYTQWWAPETERWDSIWVVSEKDTVSIPFWQPYHGLTDEDFIYRCTNDQPQTVRVYDPVTEEYGSLSLPALHVGMHVSNMTWSEPPLDDIILTRYRMFPKQFGLTNLFVSLYFRGGIGLATDYNLREQDDRSMYIPDAHLAIVSDGGMLDGIASANCVGYRLFPPLDIPSAQLWWTTKDDFSRQSAVRGLKSSNEYCKVMHGLLSSRVQMAGNVLGSNWIATGPFVLPLGDTLEIWTAEILGQGPNDVLNKSALLDLLRQRDFVTPHPPPPPPLRIERADKSLTLRWDARLGDVDPETYRDPDRWDGMETPFEGYRVYKSTQSLNGPWTPIFECDIASDGFGREFGLQHEYREDGLLNHATYYYAVTAFSKRDTVTGLPSRESRLQKTMRVAVPGLPARARVGEVAVVPNPYRTDAAYTGYDPPWERPTGRYPTWTEGDRRIQFINLPRNCIISIYTLAGDLVDLLRHEDATLSFHDWNLTSYVGQAVASGLYLFTVEDRETGEVQVGKFVIIR